MNTDPGKYKYSGYGIGFNSHSQFSWTDGSVGNNVIIFGVDNSSPMHVDGRNKKILVLGEGLTQDSLCLCNISKSFKINNMKKQTSKQKKTQD